MANDQVIEQVLRESKRILVVGLSPDPGRASNSVSRYMIKAGYELAGVRPETEPILGRPVYTSIRDAVDTTGRFDIVNVFRSPEHVPAIVEEILALPVPLRPSTLWLQEGVGHAASEARGKAAGLTVIADLCILKEHYRLLD